jgi:hypothetical protein
MPRRLPHCAGVAFALGVLWLPAPAFCADDLLDSGREPVLPPVLDFTLSGTDTQATPRADRIRLFRIMPGFLSDPVGLQDDPTVDPEGLPLKADDGPSWLQVAIGNDNQFFDVRYPGDPGGIGYTRVQSQLQVVDSQSTSCTLGVRAVTPTGAQQGGIEDGPTVVSPGFSLFHALEDGTAFQGYISKDLHVASPANLTDTLSRPSQLNRSVEYGMAVQKSLLPQDNSIFLFVEALGRYRYDQSTTTTTTSAGTLPTMEVLPGMQFKFNESWWLSGSVILPVNQTRTTDNLLWQVTCSFQF